MSSYGNGPTCDTCGQEYEDWGAAEGEPCPKKNCDGEIA